MGRKRRWCVPSLSWLLGWIMCVTVGATPAFSDCLSLKVGTMIYDAQACVAIQPERTFDVTKDKYRFIGDLDASGRKALLDGYRGLYLRGKVVKSQIVAKGMVQEEGALIGETIYGFVAPGPLNCAAVLGKRLTARLEERCCDGTGNAPCLLNTSYMLQDVKVIGGVGSAAGDAVRQKARMSEAYKSGDKAFQAKSWKAAAKAFETARANGELDVAGHLKLGISYRQLDLCPLAVAPLKRVQEMREKNEIWADEDDTARDAEMLLARCYSRMNRAGPAVLILNSYLLEPQKYEKEIRESLAHKDFGWIKTTREYGDYKKEAQKKLQGLKSRPR